MRITVTSVLVDDQQRALEFYTDTLGFQVRHDMPMGEHRWLTVVSPEQPDGVELLLEPTAHPAAAPFQQALHADGIPATVFGVDDVRAECARLESLGVELHSGPTDYPWGVAAMVDDTCGNLIQFQQVTIDQ